MAWKTRKKGGLSSILDAPLCVLRISLGIFMIAKGLGKLAWFVDPNILVVRLHGFLERATPANRWYVALLVPGAVFFARLVPFGELASGTALILGRFTRTAALLAFLMILNFHLSTGELFRSDFPGDGQAFPVLGGLLTIALAARRPRPG